MAKETFVRTKPHVNIGTIGHVDMVRPLLQLPFLRLFTIRVSAARKLSLSTRSITLLRRKSVVSPSTLLTSSTKQLTVTTLT